jgi:hypothetical protein
MEVAQTEGGVGVLGVEGGEEDVGHRVSNREVGIIRLNV